MQPLPEMLLTSPEHVMASIACRMRRVFAFKSRLCLSSPCSEAAAARNTRAALCKQRVATSCLRNQDARKPAADLI